MCCPAVSTPLRCCPAPPWVISASHPADLKPVTCSHLSKQDQALWRTRPAPFTRVYLLLQFGVCPSQNAETCGSTPASPAREETRAFHFQSDAKEFVRTLQRRVTALLHNFLRLLILTCAFTGIFRPILLCSAGNRSNRIESASSTSLFLRTGWWGKRRSLEEESLLSMAHIFWEWGLCADDEPGLKLLCSREACTLQDLVMLPWSRGEPVLAELVLSGSNQPDWMDGFLWPHVSRSAELQSCK